MISYNKAKEILEKKAKKYYPHVKNLLNKASEAYYNSSNVILSDDEYDDLYKLYNKITGEEIIGAEPEGKKGTISVSHKYKNLVGTLRKAKNLDEIDEYLKKYFKVKKDEYNIRLSLKFDGNSVTIEYDENGNLIKALTRGKDGKGKDLTKAFKKNNFNLKPLIYEDGAFAIKYECIISYENYNKICEEFEEEYANPRSLVSGILGSDDAYKYSDYLTLVPLELRLWNNEGKMSFINNKKELFEDEIDEFYPNNYYSEYSRKVVVKDYNEAYKEIKSYYDYVNSIRSELPFMIDGIVIEFIDKEIIDTYFYDPRGYIPEHSFALKLPYLEAIGYVTDIDFCVGNSGRITPRIWFSDKDGKPIIFNGTEHTKQQISNYKRFKELNVGKGSKVLVTYNNDCLSYITKIICPENEKIEPFEYCNECPICGGDVILIENDKGEETLTECENPNCPSRILGKLENYFIRMDIKGIKINTIETLFNDKLITDIPSLYNINWKKASTSIGPKNAENMKEAIEEKMYYDYEILGSLSIEKISLETTKIICKKYNLDEIFKLYNNDILYESILELDGFSKIKTNYFCEGFEKNLDIIRFLAKRGYKNYKDEFKNVGDGLKIVFTGFRDGLLETKLERLGHKVTSSVSRKTNIVVYSDNPGATKMNKAKELGIETMYIEDFKDKFNLR